MQDLLQSTEHGNDGVEWHVVWVDGAASFTLRSKIESGGSTCGGGITGFRLQPTEALCSLLGLTPGTSDRVQLCTGGEGELLTVNRAFPAEDGWITTTNAVHDQEGVIVSMSTLPGVHRESIEASRPAAAEGSRRDSGPSSTSLDVAHGLPGNVISKENGALGSEGHHTAFSAASGAVVSSTTALQGGGADRGATAIAAAMIRDGEGGRSQGGSWRWGIRGGTGVGGASHEREEASPPPGASVKNKNSDWKSSHVIVSLGSYNILNLDNLLCALITACECFAQPSVLFNHSALLKT